jgi:hypothetical protein
MPYETTCPKGHRLQVSDSHLGQRIQCPACNESFVVPNGSRTPAPSSNRGGWTVSPAMAVDLPRLARWTGRPLVVVGLLLALLSKGCDAINQHGAVRASALAQAAVDQFEEDVQFKKQVLQNEIKGLSSRDDLKADDRKKLDELRKEAAELDAQAAKDRKSKELGEWRDLRSAARNAKRTLAVNGYWHELFFVFAAIVLVFGLLIVSWAAEGAERWISLVILAVITYSLFVGGAAWMPAAG